MVRQKIYKSDSKGCWGKMKRPTATKAVRLISSGKGDVKQRKMDLKVRGVGVEIGFS